MYVLPSLIITQHCNSDNIVGYWIFLYAECILPSHNTLQHNNNDITIIYRDILIYIKYEYITIVNNTMQ
jgi:hypothetical protein